MKKSTQLYDAGLEEYPVPDVILSNLTFAAVLAVGTYACWLISPYLGVAYLVFFVVMVYGVLRRLICTRCHYYGKRCGIGWGLLAAVWFSRRSPEEYNESAGLKLAPFVYGLMVLVPLVSLAVLLLQDATSTLLVLVALLLAVAFYNLGPGRRRSCVVCKMRLFCRGGAAK